MNITKKQTFDDLNCEDDLHEGLRVPRTALVYLIWIFQPLVLWSLGACDFQDTHSLTVLSLLLRYFFFLAGLHVVLIGPVIYFAYPELKKIKIKVLRAMALFAFLAPPLLSLGYFIGNVNHSGAVFDLIFSTSSLILVSILLFETTQNLSLLSLGLSTCLYLQWFCVGDILGPFKTTIQMVPTGDVFYWAKTSLIVLGLTLTLWRTESSSEDSVQARKKNRVFSLVLWMFLGGALYFGLPWVLSQYEIGAKLTLSYLDFLFCLIAIVIVGDSLIRGAQTRIWMGIKICVAALFMYRAMSEGFTQPATLWTMSWVAYDVVAATLIALSFN